MRIVVSGASGFMGPFVLAALRDDGHDVFQLVRREPRGAFEVRWDPSSGELDPRHVDGADAAINLSGAGVAGRRWTAEYKRTILQSRVDSTRTLATALAALRPTPTVLLNASGIDVYGDRGDEVLTERSQPDDESFLAGVVQRWEAATETAQQAGIRVALLRSGLVMAPGGGAFGRLLPLFRLGLGGRLGRGRAWWSWITLDDEIDAMRFLLANDVHGPVNLTAPEPVTNAQVTRALARALRRPAPFAVPPQALRLGLGEFAELVLGSKRVVPQVLLDAGFRFRHPTIDEAAEWVTGREAEVHPR